MNDKSIAESVKIIDDFEEEEAQLQFVADVNNPEMVYSEMKMSWLGNLEVSLFWEEKIILIIKFVQLYGFLLSVFYEQWPFKYQNELGTFLFIMSGDFYLAGGGVYQWYNLVQSYAPNAVIFTLWYIVMLVTVGFGISIYTIQSVNYKALVEARRGWNVFRLFHWWIEVI